MTDQVKPAFATASTSRSTLVIAVYTAAIFLSAALLFAVQPMFTKIVLPRFGGSPSVWAVAMVFFQGILLLGYAYADALTRFARSPPGAADPPRRDAGRGHVPAARDRRRLGHADTPAARRLFLLGLFAVSHRLSVLRAVGERSAAAGVVRPQRSCPTRSNPYFLYAASNIGSLLALFAYPVVGRAAVDAELSGRALALRLLSADRADRALRRAGVSRATPRARCARAATEAAPAPGRMVYWVALAFVPSALMVAVTTHVTTDVAAAPFLWVLPLSLYLITLHPGVQRAYVDSAGAAAGGAAGADGAGRADAGARYPDMADHRCRRCTCCSSSSRR